MKLLKAKKFPWGLVIGGFAILAFFCLSLPAQAAPAAAPMAQLTPFLTPTPGPDGKVYYIVQPGDTLWRISAITGVPLETLRALNNLGLNDPIKPGDKLLLGLAGPVVITPTVGPSPTPAPILPTPTRPVSLGILCVLLYNDQNGDSMRQASESALIGGAISVNNRSGTFSKTADTGDEADTECNRDPLTGYDPAMGFVAFTDIPEGEYTVSVAVPEGYNATTEMNRSLQVNGGDIVRVTFGAQMNAKTTVETQVIPEAPNKSPLLGILGGVILVVGIGLGVYAVLLRRGGGRVKGQG